MKCKNKEIAVIGIEYDGKKFIKKKIYCICTNDEQGKTLSIDNGCIQFSIPFEAIAECFEGDYRKGEKWLCESCVYYPPSSGDGKPCSMCDTNDADFNHYCKREKE